MAKTKMMFSGPVLRAASQDLYMDLADNQGSPEESEDDEEDETSSSDAKVGDERVAALRLVPVPSPSTAPKVGDMTGLPDQDAHALEVPLDDLKKRLGEARQLLEKVRVEKGSVTPDDTVASARLHPVAPNDQSSRAAAVKARVEQLRTSMKQFLVCGVLSWHLASLPILFFLKSWFLPD